MHPTVRRGLRLINSYKGEIDREFVVGYVLATGVMMAVGYAAIGGLQLALLLAPPPWPSWFLPLISVGATIAVLAAFAGPIGALLVKRHRSMGLPGWTGPTCGLALTAVPIALSKLGFVQGAGAVQGSIALAAGWQAALLLWPARHPDGTAEAAAFA
jgi:hypothetical protein